MGNEAAFQDVLEAEPGFGRAQAEGFSVYIRQCVFAVTTEALRDVILVPSEDADRFADRDKFQAELYLAAKPDVIPDDAIFGRVGATFPDLSAKQERAGLDRHMPICIDRAGYRDLVEQVKKVQILIEHDGRAKTASAPVL